MAFFLPNFGVFFVVFFSKTGIRSVRQDWYTDDITIYLLEQLKPSNSFDVSLQHSSTFDYCCNVL